GFLSHIKGALRLRDAPAACGAERRGRGGGDITLPCRAPNNTNMIGVMWKRADLGEEYVYLNRQGYPQPQKQHLSFKNRVDLQDKQMKDGDVSLILKKVTTNDTGTYKCLVFKEETHPWISVCNITLSVVDPPGSVGLKVDPSVILLFLFCVFLVVIIIIIVICSRQWKKYPILKKICSFLTKTSQLPNINGYEPGKVIDNNNV
uniref:Ig-like domain-containing protein n=1 Tax=Pundamilia nyererei TaxID=303518 RepID=A0A3B4GXI4_9CICH